MNSLLAVKINLPGGIISAGDLAEILESAAKCKVRFLRFGNRQQVYLLVDQDQVRAIERELITAGILYELGDCQYPNICSSYVCAELFTGTSWLSEGVYKDALGSFDFIPRLKINLTDNRQSLIPVLNGNLNFIAAELNNYWHFCIRFPKTNKLFNWPSLIYTDEIASLCKAVEHQLSAHQEAYTGHESPDGHKLYQLVQKTLKGNWQSIETPLKPERFKLPAYEGFHSYENRLWLGVYQRTELFSVSLLKDICDLSLQLKLGQLYTTPYKSIIIKGIELSARAIWEALLEKHQINTNHSYNELNWQLEDLSDEALELKIFLAHYLDLKDITTAGLSFTIKTNPASGLYGAVTIRKDKASTKNQPRFTIEYPENFEPHSNSTIRVITGLTKSKLPEELKQICSEYYAFKTVAFTVEKVEIVQKQVENTYKSETGLYQCGDCLTIFDEGYGDLMQGIEAGVSFNLIHDYKCGLCEAPAARFSRISSY